MEPEDCGPLHRQACKVLIVLLAVWIGWAGLAYPTGRPIVRWPWSRSWFMFFRASDREFRLGALGRFADGSVRELDLGRWFRRRAGLRTRRIDELHRDEWTFGAFADFLCRAHNADGPAPRLESISVLDRSWVLPAGRWLNQDQAPPRGIHVRIWVGDRACP